MNEFEENVERYIKVHRTLHGEKSYNNDAVAKDLFNSFAYPIEKSLEEINRRDIINAVGLSAKIKAGKSIGVFIGRAQPFHKGHDAIIQEIIRDNKIPLVVLGGVGKEDDRHPLTYKERVNLIKKVYPMNIKFIGLHDKDCWDSWYDSLMTEIEALNIDKENITIYTHNKIVDKIESFEFRDVLYSNEYYTKMFEVNDIKIKKMNEIKCSANIVIHASDIRNNEEIAKKNLDARIYIALKNTFNWWKD